MLVAQPLKDQNRVTRSVPLFDPERVVLDGDTNNQGCAVSVPEPKLTRRCGLAAERGMDRHRDHPWFI